MAQNNKISHNEFNGKRSLDLKDRLDQVYKNAYASESVGSMIENHYNARNLVAHLLLDDGIKARSNREDLMDTDWKSVGIGDYSSC